MIKNIVYSFIFSFIIFVGMYLLYMTYQVNFIKFDTEKIKISLDNESWTNKNVTITVDYDGKPSVEAYSFDGGITWQKENTFTVTKNQKVEVVLKGSFERKSSEVVYHISNIDKEIPSLDMNEVVYVAKGKELNLSEHYNALDYVSGISDVKINNETSIDVNTLGDYDIDIQITDKAGNIYTQSAVVSVVKKNNPNLLENNKNVAVTGISVDKTKINLVKGTTVKITPTIKPSNATNKKVTYSSVNTSVAKVDNNGVITAVGAGSTTITVTTADGKKKSDISVVVTDKAIVVETITLDRRTDTVTTDSGKIVLTATIKPENATNSDLTWSSSKLTVATVKNGEITVRGEGETTISATSSNGKVATYHLIVKDTYVFQELEIIKRKEVVGYEIKVYKNGVDITKDITAITSPISVTPTRKKKFEITFIQHDNLKDNITIMYENTKRTVKRG